MYNLSLDPLAVGDAVLFDPQRYNWPLGLEQGHDKVPRKIIAITGDVVDVKWADGHETVHLVHDHEVCTCARVERDQKVRGTMEVQGTMTGRFPAKGDLPPM